MRTIREHQPYREDPGRRQGGTRDIVNQGDAKPRAPLRCCSSGQGSKCAMCNLYTNTTSQEAMRRLFEGLSDSAGNLEPGRVYPDQQGAIIRHEGEDGKLELVKARWGMPSPPSVLKTERDPGVTNVRNL